MKLTGYILTLESLTETTAEIVREWRNSAAIRSQMEYQKHITKEEQKEWFLSIQNPEYNYFLIRHRDKPIGLIHLAHINYVVKTADVGLFIGEETYYGTGVALDASVTILMYAFEKLNLEKLHAKVKIGNTSAEKYNQLLGFNRINSINHQFALWEMDSATFFEKKTKLEKLLRVI